MKKLMSLLLAAVMLLSFAACSGNGGKTAEKTQEPTEAPTAEPTEEPTEAPTPEPTEEPEPKYAIGDTVSTDIMSLKLEASEPAIALHNSWGLSGSSDWGKVVFTPKEYNAAEDAKNPYVAATGHTLIYFCITISNLDRTRLSYASSSMDLERYYKIEYNGNTSAKLATGAERSNKDNYVGNSMGGATKIPANQWYQSTILGLEVEETATARLYFDIPTDISNLTEGYTLSFQLKNSNGSMTTFSFFVPTN